jgi:hypothetical protein
MSLANLSRFCGADRHETFLRSTRFHLAKRLAQMEAEMWLLRGSLLLMLCCLPARAQEQRQDQKIDVGRGVMCDTADEVKRFIALRSGGKEPDIALKTVNGEVGNTAACNYGFVMFSGEEPIVELSVNGRPVSIVRIVVHAFGSGSAWKRVPETVQYTPLPGKGQVI